MIKIGVSACLMYPDLERQFFRTKTLCYLEKDMSEYLTRDGVLPILIPLLSENQLLTFLQEMDGFVFQGGTDVSPKSYGDSFLDENKWPGDFERDQFELRIMDYAFQHSKPVYGICRGFQLINTYFKGTLFQDLEVQLANSLTHRDAETYDHLFHEIEFSKGGYLEKLFEGIESPLVNSVHHQGVKTLGENLVVEAISRKDELIEAFTYNDMQEKFILGVQWHPEFSHTLGSKIISPNPLYELFLEAVSKFKKHC
ncbi:MAG: gamma-glutamyl-gamma-aminobutyrate hydrolase family protein [SAR324 cluster bacterium]|nr:gamma-glutamyl-gamma-aminobutyrate hydrolase family protein [SAR324 cluster bacterium]